MGTINGNEKVPLETAGGNAYVTLEQVKRFAAQSVSVGYITCATGASDSAKTVSLSDFSLTTGIRLVVKMSYANTATSPTLNVNNTGAKTLYYNGNPATADNTWEDGETLDVYYDGTNYQASNVLGGSGSGGNMILEWDTDAATTRLQVKQSQRKAGMIVSYNNPSTGWVNEQYVGTLFTNTEWVKDENWDKTVTHKQISTLTRTASLIGNYLVNSLTGELTYNGGWKSFKAEVSGYAKIHSFIGASPVGVVGMVFYDNEDTFISGYQATSASYYEEVELAIPENAVTARWSWLVDGNENQPFPYNGDYSAIPQPALNAENVAYGSGTQADFNGKVEERLEELSDLSGTIELTDINGVSNHDTPNLLNPEGFQKTFNDGIQDFTPPNEGYEMSNRIECTAGDWFTRTGTATGMVVVTDADDTNGQRLFQENGSTLGNTFQVPDDMAWVRYIRMAVEVAGVEEGTVAVCRGKQAYLGDDKGDFVTIDSLRVTKRNLAKDVSYLKSPDGKYWELYVDESHTLKIKEVDPDVIPDSELPASWDTLNLTGTFENFFDRACIMSNKFLIDMKYSGAVHVYEIPTALINEWCNFEHFYTDEGNERYIVATMENVAGNNTSGITIFDEKFNLIESGIKMVSTLNGFLDLHDFVYIADDHLILFDSMTYNVDISGVGEKNIRGAVIQEIRKENGVWKQIGGMALNDYPQLCTDAFGDLGDVVDAHPNTLGLDYDGNIIINLRNWDTWIKIRRIDNGDGTVTIGSKNKDYNEAIIGRVGGRHNSAYIDSKRVLEQGFTFTDTPAGLTDISSDEWEDWMFFHAHDVKYWGMKEINGTNYPTYTLFDNNYCTENRYVNNAYNILNKRNNIIINPKGNVSLSYNNTYDSDANYEKYTCSRVVQLSIDWENHLIKDYRIYIVPKMYAREQSGATMYAEGVISIAYSYNGGFGLWDFTTEDTQVNGHIYSGGKRLFWGQFATHRKCYRTNTYNLR